MRRGILVWLVLISISSSNAYIVSASTHLKTISERIPFAPILVKEEKSLEITISNTNLFTTEPSKPILPMYVKVYTFPPGTRILGISCQPTGIYLKKVKTSPLIAPEPTALSLLNHKKPSLIEKLLDLFSPGRGKLFLKLFDLIKNSNRKPYARQAGGKLFPERWFKYRVGYGLDNEEPRVILSVYVYPVRYDATERELQIAKGIHLTVRYVEGKIHSFDSNDDNENYEFLVITPAKFRSILQRYIEHKSSMNVPTKLVTLEEIPANGRDKQEDIKYFIKKAYEEWDVRYVLLVGDVNNFPTRFSCIASGDIETDFPSDLYYADIYKVDSDGNLEFASWDADNDGRYGEYPADNPEVDLYPDVYLGRLAVSNPKELEEVIDKIISYESSNIYENKILNIGGDTFPGDREDIDEGEYANQAVIEHMPGINFTRIWSSGGIPDKGDLELSTWNIIEQFNKGADFIDFSGHGSPISWATHPHGDENSWVGINLYKDIPRLHNSKLPIVVLNGCSCGNFRSGKCIAWAMVSKSGGGSIATFAASGIAYGIEGRAEISRYFGWLEVNLFKKLYRDRVVGRVWGETISAYVSTFGGLHKEDYKTVEECILFGDPTLNKVREYNNPPERPSRPQGPQQLEINTVYNYSSVTTDPDGDDIYYLFDWGDGTDSGWLGPYRSGETCTASHSWKKRGSYSIRVKAKDRNGLESEWSEPLPITVPYTSGNLPPVAKLEVKSISGPIVELDASKSYDPDGTIERFDWKWSITDKWILDKGSIISHRYTNPGRYKISVRVVDNNGAYSIATVDVEISGYAYADAGGPYYANDEDGYVVIFNACNSTGRWWRWDFDGDGAWDTGSWYTRHWVTIPTDKMISYDYSGLVSNDDKVNGLASHELPNKIRVITVKLEVKDEFGYTDSNTTKVYLRYPSNG